MILEIFTVLVCSLVQSVFGVGLLMFGTPLFLLLGYDFEQTLANVLPSAVTLAAVQLHRGWPSLEGKRTRVATVLVPAVILGLLIAIHQQLYLDIRHPIAFMLILSSIVRFILPLQRWVEKIFRDHMTHSIGLIGLIHGLTNMGGGLLALFSHAIFDDKVKVRTLIAYGYVVMGCVQLLVLILSGKNNWGGDTLLFPFLSLAVYYLVGKKLFQQTSDGLFVHLMTLLIFIFGVTLLAQTWVP